MHDETLKPNNGPKDVIGEAGPGDDRQGRSVADLSDDVKARIAQGAEFLAFGPDSENRMTLQEFADSDLRNGELRTLFIPNVITADRSGLLSKAAFETILPGLAKKLAPDGTIIIIENLAADRANFLKSINYEKYGLSAAYTNTGSEYRARLNQLKLRESSGVEETLWRTGTPFILELRRKPQSLER